MDHKSRTHSKFGPSSLHRISKCPGSVGMSEGIELPQSPEAEEGTLAHEALEYLLRMMLGQETSLDITLPKYTDEMLDYAEETVKYIENVVNFIKQDYLVYRFYVEERVHYNSDIWGTVDFAFYAEKPGKKVIGIIDYKYGRGYVDVKNNLQLVGYAMCLAREHNLTFDKVTTTIVQPRLGLNESYSYDHHEFKKWQNKIIDVVELGKKETWLYSGKHCHYCPGKVKCSKFESDVLVPVPRKIPPPVEVVPLENLYKLVDNEKAITKYLTDAKNYIRSLHLKGKGSPDYKLVKGHRRRYWNKDVPVSEAKKVLSTLGAKECVRESLDTISHIEKQLEGRIPDELVRYSAPPLKIVPRSEYGEEYIPGNDGVEALDKLED